MAPSLTAAMTALSALEVISPAVLYLAVGWRNASVSPRPCCSVAQLYSTLTEGDIEGGGGSLGSVFWVGCGRGTHDCDGVRWCCFVEEQSSSTATDALLVFCARTV